MLPGSGADAGDGALRLLPSNRDPKGLEKERTGAAEESPRRTATLGTRARSSSEAQTAD